MSELDELYKKRNNLNNQIKEIEKEIEKEKGKEKIEKSERSIAFRDSIENNIDVYNFLIRNADIDISGIKEHFSLEDWLDSFSYPYLAREYEMTIDVHFNKI